MPNEVPRLVTDDHELLHHSTLREQRSAEVRQAATPPHEHLNRLIDELGVGGHHGAQPLKEYYLNFRHPELNGIADSHSAMGATLRDQVVPSFNGAELDGGSQVGAAGDTER